MSRDCGDCGAKPGESHQPGCDVERCPRCGHQAISCGCIYEVCGMDPGTLETEHPDIYANGPTPEMYATWDAEWGHCRLPWTGRWPGETEATEFGFFCRWDDEKGWVRCDPGHPEATPDLNRLNGSHCRWDADAGRWVLPEGKGAAC